MLRVAPVVLLACLAACGREEPPERSGAGTRPAITHVPSDVPKRRAEALLNARFAAADFQLGPHALLRDSAAWRSFWSKSGLEAPEVDFRRDNVVALRIYDRSSLDGSAPRISARGGLTFLVLSQGAGPPRPAGADSVVFYRVPIEDGPVRYVAYEPDV